MKKKKRARRQAADKFNGGRIFYVGSPKALGAWARNSLDAAIKHGEDLLDDNGNTDFVFIVRIVRVLRRPRVKPVVERV